MQINTASSIKTLSTPQSLLDAISSSRLSSLSASDDDTSSTIASTSSTADQSSKPKKKEMTEIEAPLFILGAIQGLLLSPFVQNDDEDDDQDDDPDTAAAKQQEYVKRQGQLKHFTMSVLSQSAKVIEAFIGALQNGSDTTPQLLAENRVLQSSLVVLVPSLLTTIRAYNAYHIFQGDQDETIAFQSLVATAGELVSVFRPIYETNKHSANETQSSSAMSELASFVSTLLSSSVFFVSQLANANFVIEQTPVEEKTEVEVFHNVLFRNGHLVDDDARLAVRDTDTQRFMDQFIQGEGTPGRLWSRLSRSTLSASARTWNMTIRQEEIDTALRTVIVTVLYHIGQLGNVVKEASAIESGDKKLDTSEPIRRVYNQVVKMKRWFRGMHQPSNQSDDTMGPSYVTLAAIVISRCRFLLQFKPSLSQEEAALAAESKKNHPANQSSLRTSLSFRSADPRLNVFNAVLQFLQQPLPTIPTTSSSSTESTSTSTADSSSSSSSSTTTTTTTTDSSSSSSLAASDAQKTPLEPEVERYESALNATYAPLLKARTERANKFLFGFAMFSSLLDQAHNQPTVFQSYLPATLEVIKETIGAYASGKGIASAGSLKTEKDTSTASEGTSAAVISVNELSNDANNDDDDAVPDESTDQAEDNPINSYHYFSSVWGIDERIIQKLYGQVEKLWKHLLSIHDAQQVPESTAINSLLPLALPGSAYVGVEYDLRLFQNTNVLERLIAISQKQSQLTTISLLSWQLLRMLINSVLSLGAKRKHHVPPFIPAEQRQGGRSPSHVVASLLLNQLEQAEKQIGRAALRNSGSVNRNVGKHLSLTTSLLLSVCHDKSMADELSSPRWLATIQRLIQNSWIRREHSTILPLMVSTLKFILPHQDPVKVLSAGESNIVISLLGLIGRALIANPPNKQHWDEEDNAVAPGTSSAGASSSSKAGTSSGDEGTMARVIAGDEAPDAVDRIPSSVIAVAALVVMRTLHRRANWRTHTTRLFSAMLNPLPELIDQVAKSSFKARAPSAFRSALAVLFVLGGALPSLAPGMIVKYVNPRTDHVERGILLPVEQAQAGLRILPNGDPNIIDLPPSLLLSVNDQSPVLVTEPFLDVVLATWRKFSATQEELALSSTSVASTTLAKRPPLYFDQCRAAIARVLFRCLRSESVLKRLSSEPEWVSSVIKFSNSARSHLVVDELEYQLYVADRELRRRYSSSGSGIVEETREITLTERAAMFKKGLRLEARDLTSPDTIRPCNVFDVDGPFVRLRMEGWDDRYDYWVRVDSPNIGPVGAASKQKLELAKPRYYTAAFEWDKYLKEKSYKAVPEQAFIFPTIRSFTKQHCYTNAKYKRGAFHDQNLAQRISGISVDSKARMISAEKKSDIGSFLNDVFLVDDDSGEPFTESAITEAQSGGGAASILSENETLSCNQMSTREIAMNASRWLRLLTVGFSRQIVGVLLSENKTLAKQLPVADLLGLFESLQNEKIHGKVKKVLIKSLDGYAGGHDRLQTPSSSAQDDTPTPDDSKDKPIGAEQNAINTFGTRMVERIVQWLNLSQHGFSTFFETKHPYELKIPHKQTISSIGSVQSYRVIFDPRSKVDEGHIFSFSWNNDNATKSFDNASSFESFTLDASQFSTTLVTPENGSALNALAAGLNDTPDLTPALAAAAQEWSNLKVGMKLEALDLKVSGKIHVASIVDVDGPMIRVHFEDGYHPPSDDYWAPYTHPNFGGPGTCALMGKELDAPSTSIGFFIWDDYLEENSYLPVPSTIYNSEKATIRPPVTWTDASKGTIPVSSYVRGQTSEHMELLKKYSSVESTLNSSDSSTATSDGAASSVDTSLSTDARGSSSERLSVSMSQPDLSANMSKDAKPVPKSKAWGVRFVAIPHFDKPTRPFSIVSSLLNLALQTESIRTQIVSNKAILDGLLRTVALNRMETRRAAIELLNRFLKTLADVVEENRDNLAGEVGEALVKLVEDPTVTFKPLEDLVNNTLSYAPSDTSVLSVYCQSIAEFASSITRVVELHAEANAAIEKRKAELALIEEQKRLAALAAESSSPAASSDSIANASRMSAVDLKEETVTPAWWLRTSVDNNSYEGVALSPHALSYTGNTLSGTLIPNTLAPLVKGCINNLLRVEECPDGVSAVKPARNVLIDNKRNCFTSDKGRAKNINIIIRCKTRVALHSYTLRRLTSYIGQSAAGAGIVLVSDSQPTVAELSQFNDYDAARISSWQSSSANKLASEQGVLRPVSAWSFLGTQDLQKHFPVELENGREPQANWIVIKVVRAMAVYAHDIHLEYFGLTGYRVFQDFTTSPSQLQAAAAAGTSGKIGKRMLLSQTASNNPRFESKRGATIAVEYAHLMHKSGEYTLITTPTSGISILIDADKQQSQLQMWQGDKKSTTQITADVLSGDQTQAPWKLLIIRCSPDTGKTQLLLNERVVSNDCELVLDGPTLCIGNHHENDTPFLPISKMRIYDYHVKEPALNAVVLGHEFSRIYGIGTWPIVRWERIAFGTPKHLGKGLWRVHSGTPTMRGTPGLVTGKWYYEVTLSTPAKGTIGWINLGVSLNVAKGVGNDLHGFGFDGSSRGRKFHKVSTPYGREWSKGDVIGCLLNINDGSISFSLNGQSLGVAWSGSIMPKAGTQCWYPAWTFSSGANVEVNLGWTPFVHPPPLGFLGTYDAKNEALAAKAAPAVSDSSTADSKAVAVGDGFVIPAHIKKFSDNIAVMRQFIEREPITKKTLGLIKSELSSYYHPDSVVTAAMKRVWTKAMDEVLVSIVNELAEGVDPLSGSFSTNSFKVADSYLEAHLWMKEVPVSQMRWRVDVLKYLNIKLKTLLPYMNLQNINVPGSLASEFVKVKSLMFTGTKLKWIEAQMAKYRGSRGTPEVCVRRLKNLMATRKSDRYTTFYNLYSQTRSRPDNFWQRNKSSRCWEVKYVGEGSIDDSGPFRESLTWLSKDACSDRLSLFALCPNGRSGCGFNRDTYIPNDGATSTRQMEMFKWFGKILGMSIYSGHLLDLVLSPNFWKHLVGEELTLEDYQDVDVQGYNNLKEAFEQGKISNHYFTTITPAGREVELVPDAWDTYVDDSNVKKWAQLSLKAVLGAAEPQYRAIKEGLGRVVPLPLLYVLTPVELERWVCGERDYKVDVLKESTRVDSSLSSSDTIKYFWEVLREFSPAERSKFLSFTYGQSRLPDPKSNPNFKAMTVSKYNTSTPDKALPKAATCYFKLQLPLYSTKEILRKQLRFAINHATVIDTDGSPQVAASASSSSSDDSM